MQKLTFSLLQFLVFPTTHTDCSSSMHNNLVCCVCLHCIKGSSRAVLVESFLFQLKPTTGKKKFVQRASSTKFQKFLILAQKLSLIILCRQSFLFDTFLVIIDVVCTPEGNGMKMEKKSCFVCTRNRRQSKAVRSTPLLP